MPKLARHAPVVAVVLSCALLATNAAAATPGWTKRASAVTAKAVTFQTATQTPSGATVLGYVTSSSTSSSTGTLSWRMSSKTGWAAAHKVGTVSAPLRIVQPSLAASNNRVVTVVPVVNPKTAIVTLTLRAQSLSGKVLFTRRLTTATLFSSSSVSVDAQDRVMVVCNYTVRGSQTVSAYAVSAAGKVSARKDLQLATSKDSSHSPYEPQVTVTKTGQFVAAWLMGLGESSSDVRHATLRSATWTAGKWAKPTTLVPTERDAQYFGLSGHASRAVLAYTDYADAAQENTALRALTFHNGAWSKSKTVVASFGGQGVGVATQSVASNGTAAIAADRVYTLKPGAAKWASVADAPRESHNYCNPFIGVVAYQVNSLHWYAASAGAGNCTVVNYSRS